MYRFGKISNTKLKGCHPDLIKLFEKAIFDSPFDFGISHGHRSVAAQKFLYAKGRTQPGDIVTYCDGEKKKSKHNYEPSLAVDIFAYIDGKAVWDSDYYKVIAKHIKQVADELWESAEIKSKIRWGGDFNIWSEEEQRYISFPDYPHFEIIT